MAAGTAWSESEIEAIVSDYFEMLERELRGESYNKAEHRRALSRLLSNRSDGSIERKHQNISAVLIEARFPWIAGYKPLFNYQSLLAESVSERLDEDAELVRVAQVAVDTPAKNAPVNDLLARQTSPPTLLNAVRDALASQMATKMARRIDYLAREARNSALGRAGEDFVVAFERARLRSVGREDLARLVEHVSVTQGDGLGFDVLSFTNKGSERFLEVKTTAFGPETPFYVTQSEVDFSATTADAFELFRVFRFRTDPRLFRLPGSLPSTCSLLPVQFAAVPR